MRRTYVIGTGVTALALVAATGLAAYADKANVAARPAAHGRMAALPSGYQLVTLANANVPNFQRRTLYCPSGKHVLGGGGEARGNGAILVGSFPTDDARGWIVLGRQIGYNDVGISVFAICAD
ncbi:hypothetical protein [Actinoallomurus sp. CA-150999]|uniref:hypothetical protein n=1 Tax=Actinoallomurus sp. CA-150999 TaxID=3239887 RepID=UPI003D9022C2